MKNKKKPAGSQVVTQPPFAAAGGARSISTKEYGHPTVLMVFPEAVKLTINHGQVMDFKPGINRVPENLQNHPYLKAHGVVLAEPEPEEGEETTDGDEDEETGEEIEGDAQESDEAEVEGGGEEEPVGENSEAPADGKPRKPAKKGGRRS